MCICHTEFVPCGVWRNVRHSRADPSRLRNARSSLMSGSHTIGDSISYNVVRVNRYIDLFSIILGVDPLCGMMYGESGDCFFVVSRNVRHLLCLSPV